MPDWPLALPVWGQDQPATEIDILRSELKQLRADYDARIEDLEQRLEAAEHKADQASLEASQATLLANEPVAATAITPNSTDAVSNNAFNPALGVIFQGQAWAYDNDPEQYYIPGFPMGGEAGLAPEGFSISVYADKLPMVRFMAFTGAGDLILSRPKAGECCHSDAMPMAMACLTRCECCWQS